MRGWYEDWGAERSRGGIAGLKNFVRVEEDEEWMSKVHRRHHHSKQKPIVQSPFCIFFAIIIVSPGYSISKRSVALYKECFMKAWQRRREDVPSPILPKRLLSLLLLR